MITTYEKPQNARKTFYAKAIQYDAYRIKAYKMRLAQDITESSIKRINRLLANMSHMTSDSGPSWYRTIFFSRETKRQWPVYSVLFGMSGYMPDDVCYFTSKRAALSYMADEAKDLRSEDWTVSGSAEYGYACQAPWHDTDYFSLDWNVEYFSAKQERDQFISQNSDF